MDITMIRSEWKCKEIGSPGYGPPSIPGQNTYCITTIDTLLLLENVPALVISTFSVQAGSRGNRVALEK